MKVREMSLGISLVKCMQMVVDGIAVFNRAIMFVYHTEGILKGIVHPKMKIDIILYTYNNLLSSAEQ